MLCLVWLVNHAFQQWSRISNHPRRYFTFHNNPPWVNRVYVHASSKTPQKTSRKKDRRKEYITCITYVAPVASLKPLHEKKPVGKTCQGKKSTTVDVRVRSLGLIRDLQDHDHELWIWGWSPPEPYNSLSHLIPLPRTYLWKLEAGRDFVNRFARFAHDLTRRIFISPLF